MDFGELLPIFTWSCRKNTVELDIITELVERVKCLKYLEIKGLNDGRDGRYPQKNHKEKRRKAHAIEGIGGSPVFGFIQCFHV